MDIMQSILDFLLKFASQIALLCAGAVVNHYIGKHKEAQKRAEAAELALEKKNEALEMGMQAMLRDSILRLHRYCKIDGYITEITLDNAEKMYKSYHDLGGNGMIEGVMEEIRALPIHVV